MKAQQEAVALYLFFRSRGISPSLNSISRALRDQGIRFRETDLRAWLQPEVSLFSSISSSPTPRSSRTRSTTPKPREPWITPPVPDAVPDELPDDPDELLALAGLFQAAFVGAKDSKKAARYDSLVAQALAKVRQRGNTGPEAWEAYGKARTLNHGAPVFRAFAVIDNLPPPRWAKNGAQIEHSPSDDLPTRAELLAAERDSKERCGNPIDLASRKPPAAAT